MTTQVKQQGVNKDMQEEMVGVLTAISIVSKRLANRLSQLDERNEKKEKKQMSKTKLALDVVTDLRNLAGSIETLVFALESNQTDSAASVEKEQSKKNKESNKPAQPAKAKLPSLEDVRAKLAALSQDGKQVQVKELITGFGAKKLSDIPVERYPELLEEADKL
uniref:hypothetical protein n=1 Tax=uncultured Allobacillus sp. TaxID=1638025 RepID=UPI002593D47E|nr:hypothetical protein [uncultured Allobacillus sp.]